jgi:hypothetical protein
LTASLINDVRW